MRTYRGRDESDHCYSDLEGLLTATFHVELVLMKGDIGLRAVEKSRVEAVDHWGRLIGEMWFDGLLERDINIW